jgi:type III secretory pathway component EscV
MQQYKLYAAVGLTVLLILVIAFLWGQPSKLFMALLVLATISGGVFFYFHQQQEASNRLSGRYRTASRRPDQELNSIKGSVE